MSDRYQLENVRAKQIFEIVRAYYLYNGLYHSGDCSFICIQHKIKISDSELHEVVRELEQRGLAKVIYRNRQHRVLLSLAERKKLILERTLSTILKEWIEYHNYLPKESILRDGTKALRQLFSVPKGEKRSLYRYQSNEFLY